MLLVYAWMKIVCASILYKAISKIWPVCHWEAHPLIFTDQPWGCWVPQPQHSFLAGLEGSKSPYFHKNHEQSLWWPSLKATDHLNETTPATSVCSTDSLFRFSSVSRILKWLLIKVRWTLCILSLFCLEFPVLACEDQMHLFLIIHSTGVRQDEVSSSLRKWARKGWSAVVLGEEVSPAPPSVPGPLTLSSIHQLWCDSDRILPRSRVTVGVCDICPWWWNVGKALVLAADFSTRKALKNIFFTLQLSLEHFEKSSASRTQAAPHREVPPSMIWGDHNGKQLDRSSRSFLPCGKYVTEGI